MSRVCYWRTEDMEREGSIKDFLNEEINRLNHLIEEARKNNKDCSKHRKELIQLIIELDLLGQDD
jgi:hypothetical protein